MTNGNDNVHPVYSTDYDAHSRPVQVCENFGLTIREYFAALAMQGILAKNGWPKEPGTIAMYAVTLADSLIQKLNATNRDDTDKS